MAILRAILNMLLLLLMIALWLFMFNGATGDSSTFIHYYFADYDSSTVGTILHSKMRNGKPFSKRYDINYSYVVEGKYYTSRQVNLSANERDAASTLLSKYPTGKEVTVYYDSARPMFAVLELTKPDLFSIWGSFFTAVVFGVLTYLMLPFKNSSTLFDKLSDWLSDIGVRLRTPNTRTRYTYRISIGLRIVFVAIPVIGVLYAYGYFGDALSSDFNKYLSISVLIPLLLISIFSPYKNSYIVVKEDSVTIPSLFVPPFTPSLVLYRDILDMSAKTDKNGMGRLVIRTRSRTIKISGYFCFEKIRLVATGPDEFFDIVDGIFEKYDKYKGS